MTPWVYIAPEGRAKELASELRDIEYQKDGFFIAAGKQNAYWSQNIWFDARRAPVESIGKAAALLKKEQLRWWHYPLSCVRRTKLIQESLAKVKNSPLVFPTELPSAPLGAFALLSESEMIYSTRTQSPVPNGEYFFSPSESEMPSDAYFKLWEALTRLGKWPLRGELCVDLGAAPGSWTRALLDLGASVLSVDKAELEIAPSKKLHALKKDAFKIDPQEVNRAKWVFSDIICYPEKALELAQSWLKAQPQANFIFTIKFQGKWDQSTVERFQKIPNSRVVHLFNNKHELCWLRPAPV